MDENSPYLISGRLTFAQLLLVLTYTCLRSCLPFRIGDHRQIRDILQRQEKDWEPSIGSEGINEFNQPGYEVQAPHINEKWEEIRKSLIQGLCCFPISVSDMRGQLRYIFNSIEQISAQGLNTICLQPQKLAAPTTPLGSNGTVTLICISLSVVMSGYSQPLQWEPDDSTINEMLRHLNQSPLFPDVITWDELRTALCSLELLFYREDNRFAATISELPNRTSMEQEAGFWETQIWQYGGFGKLQRSKTTRGPGSGEKRTLDSTENEIQWCGEERQASRKRQKHMATHKI